MLKGHIFRFYFQDIPSFEPLPLQTNLDGHFEIAILFNVHTTTAITLTTSITTRTLVPDI